MTNSDKIRQMTDLKLAELFLESRQICKLCKRRYEICEGSYHECFDGIVEFLKSEVSENAES